MKKERTNKEPSIKNNTNSAKPSSDTDELVTRRILNEELEAQDYVTKDYLREYMSGEMTIQRKEYERYVGALAEDFQSKLDAIAEVVVATAEDLTSIKDWIKEDHYTVHKHIDFRLSALESSTGNVS